MNDKELTRILGHCLDQIAAGDTVAACLAQHPEQAAELAPLLAMAGELGSLRDCRLSEAARQRARAGLLRAEVARNQSRVMPWWQSGAFGVSRLAAGLAMALFCVILTTGMVAASRPGDVAYPLRVLVERAPVLLTTTAAARATTELRIADRRLTDLASYLAAKDAIEPAAIAALLAGDQAAAAKAEALPEAERVQAASHVAAHAAALALLAQSAHQPSAEMALQAAAVRAGSLAEDIERGGTVTGGARPTSDARPTQTRSAPVIVEPPAVVTPTPEPQASETPTVTPSPTNWQPAHSSETPTARPIAPGQRATALARTATASPVTATATQNVTEIRPSGTPIPGRRATALAQTATVPVPATAGTPVPGRRATALAQTATAPAFGATHTSEPSPVHTPNRGSDTPAPGQQPTAPAQTVTSAPASGATNTPEPSSVHTPMRGSATPAPGRRATALAQTATPAPAHTGGPNASQTPRSP
jgi:hypothetical protein